jgi:HTH-type transcriptional regulator/antitoxin HigA
MKRATKARPAGKRPANGRPAAAYLALIEHFPLRPLRSERDYDVAVAILDVLAVRPERSLERGEQDYFDTLTILVEAYDEEHHGMDAEDGDPLTMLKYVMDESGMTQADLGRLLGNRALASLILNGHRQLSKTHIRKLADHFKVSPALFLHAKEDVAKKPGPLRQ